MTITLRLIGLFGVFLFSASFAVTFFSANTIEESAKNFVKHQIEKDIREKQRSLQESSFATKAINLAESLGVEAERIQENLDDNLPEKIASVIASMCGYDCERKKQLTKSIASGYLERLKNIEVAQNNLGELIKGRYIEILGQLKTDLRIFLGSNFLMFLVLLSVSFAKPKTIPHLFLPGMLLLLATIISVSIYIFGQDWFYTILYNDYIGFGYLAYIGGIFGVLMDIVFNRARVTTEVINFILNAIGSAFSVLPC